MGTRAIGVKQEKEKDREEVLLSLGYKVLAAV